MAVKDHPRMRGEDPVVRESDSPSAGSPPHARGRLEGDHLIVRYTRITPACAGKTMRRTSRSTLRRDHPRMRGEDLSVAQTTKSVSGSPPHARGRLRRRERRIRARRITPACAGKTAGRDPRKIR